ncbi:MAG: hypothetical protein JWP27_456 [Flaviaesturariibacter sp.]|nr:hypothetical protein [Flaviaesturariibacter sp.]
MTFTDFKFLPLPFQAHLVCSRGVLLAERAEGDFHFSLYALDSFYVEVCFRTEDSEVIRLLSFYHTFFLEPYLETITLAELAGHAAVSAVRH